MKLYGRNCVIERLKKDAKSVKRIFAEAGADISGAGHICRQRGIPVEYLSKNIFQKKAQGIPSQGIIAETDDFKYAQLEDILELPKEKLPVLLFLDSLNDPQNLGSILRTSACFGGFAVILPRHESVEVTEAVLRVAQGGENYTPVCKVANLSVAVEKARKAGYWIIGAATEGGEDLTAARLNFPLGVVIGSEARGIRQGLRSHLDNKFTLQMAGAQLSFNAAVAAALFCYEAARQRKKC